MEEEWATLEELQQSLNDKLSHQKKDKDSIKETFLQAERLFTDPVKTRKEFDFQIRQSLIMVWFGGILYYDKKQ